MISFFRTKVVSKICPADLAAIHAAPPHLALHPLFYAGHLAHPVAHLSQLKQQ